MKIIEEKADALYIPSPNFSNKHFFLPTFCPILSVNTYETQFLFTLIQWFKLFQNLFTITSLNRLIRNHSNTASMIKNGSSHLVNTVPQTIWEKTTEFSKPNSQTRSYSIHLNTALFPPEVMIQNGLVSHTPVFYTLWKTIQ